MGTFYITIGIYRNKHGTYGLHHSDKWLAIYQQWKEEGKLCWASFAAGLLFFFSCIMYMMVYITEQSLEPESLLLPFVSHLDIVDIQTKIY